MPSSGDINLAVDGDGRRMTYAELAAVRGISITSARRLVLRHRWPRQIGNDGIVRVIVPLTALIKADLSEGRDTATDHMTVTLTDSAERAGTAGFCDTVTTAPLLYPPDPSTVSVDPVSDPMTVTLTRALDTLREHLALANERANHAEQLLVDERRRVEELQAKLANAVASERMLADKDATIAHLRRQIENLMTLLTARRSWWRRWFR